MVLQIVPQRDYEVIKKYLGNGQDVLLLPEDTLRELPGADQESLEQPDDRMKECMDSYNFGGEPDVRIDLIEDVGHYVLDCLLDR